MYLYCNSMGSKKSGGRTRLRSLLGYGGSSYNANRWCMGGALFPAVRVVRLIMMMMLTMTHQE